MADSVTVANLPVGFDLYGAYLDGAYANYEQAVARFTASKVVGIAVFPTTNAGIVGDCESGDMTPLTAVTWVVMRRKSGADPTIYCSEAAWQAVQLAFCWAGVPEPHYWIAAYPGNGQQLYAGAVAHQWIDHGPYDESIVADYWPGVDPPPSNVKEADMIASTPTGNGYWIVKPGDGSIYSFGDATWLGALNWPKNALVPGDIVTGFASHPTQPGYWISTAKGFVYAFGAAAYHGGAN